jgi:hypothetical protein
MRRVFEQWVAVAVAILFCFGSQPQAQEVKIAVERHLFVHALDALDGLELHATMARITEEDGVKALELNGMVLVPDLAAEDVGIEVEIYAPAPCYPGIAFRLTDMGSFELAYAVPVASGEADAIQYDPVFNGSNTWQVYTGPAYQQQATVPLGEWFTLRIDVVGDRAAIRVGDQPPLVVECLAHGRSQGRIGLWTYRPARFRNLRVTGPRLFEDISGERPQAPQGCVAEWWSEATGAARVEPNGVLNLNRYLRCPPTEVQLSRSFTLKDEADLDITCGFSDHLSLSLDGDLLFDGSNTFAGFESEEARGWVRPGYQHLTRRTLPGLHQLQAVVSVTEPFGWGLVVAVTGGDITLLPVVPTNSGKP